jgi:hypothetical protein
MNELEFLLQKVQLLEKMVEALSTITEAKGKSIDAVNHIRYSNKKN